MNMQGEHAYDLQPDHVPSDELDGVGGQVDLGPQDKVVYIV